MRTLGFTSSLRPMASAITLASCTCGMSVRSSSSTRSSSARKASTWPSRPACISSSLAARALMASSSASLRASSCSRARCTPPSSARRLSSKAARSFSSLSVAFLRSSSRDADILAKRSSMALRSRATSSSTLTLMALPSASPSSCCAKPQSMTPPARSAPCPPAPASFLRAASTGCTSRKTWRAPRMSRSECSSTRAPSRGAPFTKDVDPVRGVMVTVLPFVSSPTSTVAWRLAMPGPSSTTSLPGSEPTVVRAEGLRK
mmetsp:Transcript_19319/g.56952  ORF Transcript_19319/g.56952 Transcript_19319/m.56952 type:complete len:260 (+) Transcript_19319:1-780(+)